MNTKSTFEIKLQLFEGPFDLLLFFIQRDELDIYNIPIAKVTQDFLSYLEQLEKMNVEVASEFILVAATLMQIKAKTLLPRPIVNEEGEEIDPRDDLVKHLLEYKKYKSVVGVLSQMESDRLEKEKRGNIKKEIQVLAESTNIESELQDLNLFKLMRVFQKVISRFEMESNKPVHKIEQYKYSLENQKSVLMKALSTRKKMSFKEMVSENPNKILVIFNFLAILELLQFQLINIQIGEGFNNFWIERCDELS